LRLLRSLTDKNRKINQEEALKWFENDDYVEWFQISLIYQYLSRNEGLQISEEQINWINDWSLKNLENVNFKEALTQKENGSTSSDYRAIYLSYFLRKFDFSYPDNVLLDMISFDHMKDFGWVGIDYLKEKLDSESIRKRIIQNLREGINVVPVLINHVDYVIENKIEDLYPIIHREILNEKLDDHDRRTILDKYFESTEDIKGLKEILSNSDESIRWEIVKKLYEEQDFDYLESYLLNIIHSDFDEEEKIKAAEFLVRLNNMEGLKYYSTWLTRDWLTRDKPSEYNYSKTECLCKLRNKEAIPYLLDLLKQSYEMKIHHDGINYLRNGVLDGFNRIALKSDENFEKVVASLRGFMEEHKETKNVKYLLHTIERMEQKFYMDKAQSYSIKEVKEKLRLLQN
jgi:hypothetical protein